MSIEKMDRQVANELVRIARSLVSLEFDTKEEMEAYKKEHKVRPGTKLTVKKPTDKKKPAMGNKIERIEKSIRGKEVQTLLESGNLKDRTVKNIMLESDYKQDLWDAEADYEAKNGKPTEKIGDLLKSGFLKEDVVRRVLFDTDRGLMEGAMSDYIDSKLEKRGK